MLSVLEQLPLTLQRNFSLMRDLDEQVAGMMTRNAANYLVKG
jgi:Inhibitor of growth proteins N-terminal histone-binding